MSSPFVLAIDQGTSSTKTVIFDAEGKVICKASEPLKLYFPKEGHVEQNPEEIYQNVLISVRKCLDIFSSQGGNITSIVACGISNQRETFVIWDEEGKPLYNAIVWQCKRSIAICERLEKDGLQPIIKSKTGLIADPYFSGTKVIWLYENEEKVRKAIDSGNAFFGTIDTWLLYKLTKGKSYFIDYTNASRTLFFNLKSLEWDQELLAIFGLSRLNLPQPKPSASFFGKSDLNGLLNAPIDITSMIGDSHAAAFGEGCFTSGTAKATLGTGCSILMNVGTSLKESGHGMISTICWSTEDRVDYALEGVIVSCGATIEWLKNQMQLFVESRETEAMAKAVPDNGGVFIIPAFSGLGAPHWQMSRRASISGLTFGSTKNHVIRAALESIAYQIKDVITAMEKDSGISLEEIMVNGGMITNLFLLQYIASVLDKPVVNRGLADISAQGAAYLAGIKANVYKDLQFLSCLNNERKVILPEKGSEKFQNNYNEWVAIVKNYKEDV